MASWQLKRNSLGRTVNFEGLPLEVQVRIFSELNRKELLTAAKVCKNWKNVAYVPSLWKDVSIGIALDDEAKVSWIMESMQRCTMLRSIRLRKIKSLLTDCQNNPKDFGNIVWKFIDFLTSTFTEIEQIDFSDFFCLTDESLLLISRWRNLKSLSLPRYFEQHVSTDSISALVNYCSLLESLCLRGQWENAYVLDDICASPGNILKKLTLDIKRLRDDDISSLSKCETLTDLYIHRCPRLTDACFEHLKNMKSLKRLKLENVSEVTWRGFAALCSGTTAKNLESLQLIDIDLYNDDGMNHVVKMCTKLKVLICEGRNGVTEDGLTEIRRWAKCEVKCLPDDYNLCILEERW